MKKRILAILCALTLAASLMAIPTAAATTAPKLVPTNIPSKFPVIKQDPSYTVIDFWTAVTGSAAVTANNVVNWFNATVGKQKNIYVKAIYQGAYTDAATKLQATIQAKNIKALPDIAQLAPQGAFALKESPYMLYMDDMLAKDKTFSLKDKVNANLLYACTYKGRQMGLPFTNSVIVYHYNVNAYKAVGLDPNTPPKTMADLVDHVKKLVIKDAKGRVTRYGTVSRMDGTNIATLVCRQLGGKGTSFQFDQEDGRTGAPTKYICAENGTLKAMMTEWKKVTDTGCVDYKSSSGATPFNTGTTASYIGSIVGYASAESYFATMKDKSKKFEHKMARMPLINADDGISSHIGGAAVYMFNKGDAKKQAATWEFVKFLATPDVSAYFAIATGYYAVNQNALNTKYMQDVYKADPNAKGQYTILAESSSNVKTQAPMIPNSDAYTSITGDQIMLMIQGKQTIDKAIENIAKKENLLLKAWHDAND